MRVDVIPVALVRHCLIGLRVLGPGAAALSWPWPGLERCRNYVKPRSVNPGESGR